MSQADTYVLSCSFCHKSQDSVSKLISSASPSDYRRANICDECIAVCAAILEDDRDQSAAVSGTPVTEGEKHPLLSHRLVSSLLTAVEKWIRRESVGGNAAQEIAEVRRVAVKIMEIKNPGIPYSPDQRGRVLRTTWTCIVGKPPIETDLRSPSVTRKDRAFPVKLKTEEPHFQL